MTDEEYLKPISDLECGALRAEVSGSRLLIELNYRPGEGVLVTKSEASALVEWLQRAIA